METTTYKIKDVATQKYLSGKHPKFRFTSIGRVFTEEKDIRRHAKMFVNHWRNNGKGGEPMNWTVERFNSGTVDSLSIEDFHDGKPF